MNKTRKTFSYAKYGYLFSLPFIIAFLVFSLYPTIYTAILAFTDCKGLGNTNWHLLTDDLWANFRKIFKNQMFKTSLQNTLVIWIVNFIPQMTIALVLTAWFTSHSFDIKGKGFFKVVFYMPNIITAATVAMLFYSLFSYPKGPINDLLKDVGIFQTNYDFHTDKVVSKLVVAFIQFWMWYGNTMIVLISGVLGISPDIYEAAQIDGANGVQTFFRITIPNLKTVLLYTLVTSLVGGLNMYDIPKLYLDGGPDNATLTTSVFIYKKAFSGMYIYNQAAAASMIMFIIISVLSGLLFYIMRDKDEVRENRERRAARKAAKLEARRSR